MLFLKFFYDVYWYYCAAALPVFLCNNSYVCDGINDVVIYESGTNLKAIASRDVFAENKLLKAHKNTSMALAKAAHALQVNVMFAYTLLATVCCSETEQQVAVWDIFMICSTLYYAGDLLLHTLCFDERNVANTLHHIISLFGCACWFTIMRVNFDVQQCCIILFGIIEASSLFVLPLRLRLMEKDSVEQQALNKRYYLCDWYTKTVAGICFTLAFIAARFVAFPYYWWHYSPQSLPPAVSHYVALPIMLVSTFWLFKLLHGVYKEVFCSKKMKID